MHANRFARTTAALALAAAAFGAHAASTLYTDAASFGNAVASLGLTLDMGDIAGTAAAHGVTDSDVYAVGDSDPMLIGSTSITGLAPGNAAGFLVQNTYGIAGPFYTHQMFNGTDNALTISFATPVRAFSFVGNVFNVTIDGPLGALPLTLTTSGGEVLNAFSTELYYAGIPPGSAPTVFNGIVSSSSFTSLTLSAATQAIQITAFSVAAVPEPGSAALMLAGLAAAFFIARRQRGGLS